MMMKTQKMKVSTPSKTRKVQPTKTKTHKQLLPPPPVKSQLPFKVSDPTSVLPPDNSANSEPDSSEDSLDSQV